MIIQHSFPHLRQILWIIVTLLMLILSLFADQTPGWGQTTPLSQFYLPVILRSERVYAFNLGYVERCDPNAGITYVNGTTYQQGQPISGQWVAFSYAPDGPIVAKIESGPHQGYPNWPPGFYSHILGAHGPREGEWYFWIVDEHDTRISVLVHLHTDGQAGDGKCQQAILNFDNQSGTIQGKSQ